MGLGVDHYSKAFDIPKLRSLRVLNGYFLGIGKSNSSISSARYVKLPRNLEMTRVHNPNLGIALP
jgi:hypothetical protein